MLGVGYLLSGWISVGFYYVPATTTQWRVPLALQVVPPLALLIGFKFLVESPRYRKYALLPVYRDRQD